MGDMDGICLIERIVKFNAFLTKHGQNEVQALELLAKLLWLASEPSRR